MRRQLLIVLATILLLSCSKDSDPVAPVEPELEAGGFLIGEVIGVFVIPRTGPDPNPADCWTGLLNTPYRFDGRRWSAVDGYDNYIDGSHDYDIYAYYPYDEQLGRIDDKIDYTAYRFSVADAAQVSGADLRWAFDAMSPGDGYPVTLRFTRLMSRVVITIIGVPASASNALTLHNVQTDVLLDLRSGSLTPTLVTGSTTTLFYEAAYVAAIPPQTIAGGTPMLTVEIGGVSYIWIAESDIVCEAGQTTTINLELIPRNREVGNLHGILRKL